MEYYQTEAVSRGYVSVNAALLIFAEICGIMGTNQQVDESYYCDI